MSTIVNATVTANTFVNSGVPKTDTVPAVGAGNSCVYIFPIDGALSITAITLGGVAGTLVDSMLHAATNTRNYWYRWDSVSGAPTSLAVTLNGNHNHAPGTFLECAPLATATSGSTLTGSTGTSISPSVTTTDNNSLITGCVIGVNEVVTPPSGYTKAPASGTSYEFQVYNPNPGAAGTYTPVLNATPANSWSARLVSFANAGGSPPPPPPPPPSGDYTYLGASDTPYVSGPGETTMQHTITYTGGESVIVTASAWNLGPIVGPTLSDGTHTYTLIGNFGEHQVLWYCHNMTAGTYTLSFARTGSGVYGSGRAYRFSGLKNAPPIASASSRAGAGGIGGSDNLPAGSPNVSVVPALLFGVTRKQNDSNPPSAGTGFTSIPEQLIHFTGSYTTNGRAEHRKVTTAGVVPVTFTTIDTFEGYENASVAFEIQAASNLLRDDVFLGGGPLGSGPIGLISRAPYPAGTVGYVKVWNGSAFVLKPVKVWNGSAWVTKRAKRWNGSAWL